ncbi:hypothetical protein FR264_20610 [Vibrio vulnificus]|nr:hypothetical protein [Vibrio vulnificus]
MSNLQFGIKIDYSRDEENSSRVFHAMGDLIDGINEMQQAVIDSTGLQLRLSSKLSRTIEGSVVGVQNNSLKNTDGTAYEKDNFLLQVQKKIESFLGKPAEHNTREPFKNLANELHKEVVDSFENDASSALKITHIDDYRIAKGAEKALNAIRIQLTEQDKVYVGIGDKSVEPNNRIGKSISISKSVDEIYSSEKDFPHEKIALEIVNAAFSGNTWRFKWLCKVTGRQEFSAKITHADWLENWFNRQVTILPGDGLRVDLRVYMTDKMKRVRHEIEAVHGVIPRTEMMQLLMDDQENA